MSRLPLHQVFPAMAALNAPGREKLEVVRKEINGRLLIWIFQLNLWATPTHSYRSEQLVEAPTGDCSCSLLGPEDAFACSFCPAINCSKHSATCSACGLVVGSECAKGIFIEGASYVVCKPCAKALTSSTLKRTVSAAWSWIWR